MVVCLVYTTDAADEEGSNGGSGSGTGSGSAGVVDSASWYGKATLATMDYGVLRLIASFLPLNGWVTIMPTVFAGALYAVYEGRPLPTRRKELFNTIVDAYKETVSKVETEVKSLQEAGTLSEGALKEMAAILKKVADAMEKATGQLTQPAFAENIITTLAEVPSVAISTTAEAADAESGYGDAAEAESSNHSGSPVNETELNTILPTSGQYFR